jgi:diadenosine tetraphosphate (Ap4A) HIT family hydrolase
MDKFEAYKIFTGTHWDVYLDHLQPRLGQVYIWAKNNGDVTDLSEASHEEFQELHLLMQKVRQALATLFSPDLFNYASLGNTVRHLHVHMIPRYKDSRSFENVEFTDHTFGQHYEVNPPTKKLSAEWIEKLRRAISDQIKL